MYRSAQPNHLQMQSLDRIGIRSVLNLRQWHSDADEAKGTGLILYRVPMNAAAINNDDVVIALSFTSCGKTGAGALLARQRSYRDDCRALPTAV